jgi:hypothetical protein
MQALCSKCDQVLVGNDINIVTDVARCLRCDEVFALSSLVQTNASGPVDLNDPPRGTWYQWEPNGFVVGATCRFSVPLLIHLCLSSHPFLHFFDKIVRGKLGLVDWLVWIPLILVMLLLFGLMAVCGRKAIVRVRDSEGVVFTGIGPFGWRRRFDPRQITIVRTYHSDINRNIIVQDGPRKHCFVISWLTKVQRDFVANVLRRELTKRN